MSLSAEQSRRPKFFENSLLFVAGVLAQAPLYYQLPRWAIGLDPTFVHPDWLADASIPFLLHMSTVHPLVWICISVVIFIRICRNYGWGFKR